MPRVLSAVAAGTILAGPTAIAFFSGGFFDVPRLVAAMAGLALVLTAALLAERPIPRGWPGRLALAGLAGLALWSALSLTWAPLGGPALDDVQRLVLYTATLTAAAAWLRPGSPAAAAEPALALGALVVIGYALSERLLPGLLDFQGSGAAGGRLEQPITYWNAMGAVAALGLVLCARLAGSSHRPPVLRALGAAAVPALAAGVYLTLSRSALAALAAGVLALVVLAPTRPQLRGVGLAAAVGLPAAVLAALLPAIGSADGGSEAAGQGALMLLALLALAAAAAAAQLRLAGLERRRRLAVGAVERRRVGVITSALAVAVVAAAVVAVVSGGDGRRSGEVGPRASRLASLESSRYDYWQIALDSFAQAPLQGVGTGGFRVEWLREREVAETARDAHSLYVETAAELGLVGLALLGGLVAGVALSARRAYGAEPAVIAGPAAALTAFGVHAGLDWDWEMPAVTLIALALAGLLVAAGDGGRAALSFDSPEHGGGAG